MIPTEAPEDTRARVYRRTLDFVAGNLPRATVYQLDDNRALLDLIEKNDFAAVVCDASIPRDTALLVKGLGLVQIVFGMREDLRTVSDIIIDPLVSQSEQYLVGTRFLLPAILDSLPAAELAEYLGLDEDTLRAEVRVNRAGEELLEIVRLFRKLDWDSDFFGVNVGYISCLRLTPNIERQIRCFIRDEKIDMLEYLCNCHDKESVLTLEANGYSFVDIRLTFERRIAADAVIEERSGYAVRKGTLDDIPRLRELATDIYKLSRYYFDRNFDRAKVVDFYIGWVEKAIRGQYDDFSYVLYHDDLPVGFCTIKIVHENAARVGLVGIDAAESGGGLAGYLLQISLQKLRREENVDYIEVVTQGRNYAAQRLYQRCGFITKSTELWYHKWFR